MNACSMREMHLFRVARLSFMVDDLQLFLNTHPQCQEAFALLKRYQSLEKAAQDEYQRLYGPITLDHMQDDCQYSWVSGPWPWHMEV